MMMEPKESETNQPGSSPPQSQAGPPVLDIQVLEELRQYSDKDHDLVQELIQIFLADSPMQLLSLQDALRDENWTEVERRSHRLKGSAGSIGAVRLRELCEEIELHARQRDLAAPGETATRIWNELEALKQQLIQSLPE